MNKNPNCGGSHCRVATGPVKLYPTGGGGNDILCRDCWEYQNNYNRWRSDETGKVGAFPQLDFDAVNGPEEWEVLVGNIGRVYLGNNEGAARRVFAHYVTLSSAGHCRAAGENVTLMRDGEPVAEHYGTEERAD